MAKLTAGTTKTASKKEKRNRTLHETSSFQYGVSSLNLTKSTVNCRKQLIRFHKTVEWKIIEETPTSSNIEGNKNHEMSLVDQLSNLSLYKDEIKTHKTLLRTKKKRKTLS